MSEGYVVALGFGVVVIISCIATLFYTFGYTDGHEEKPSQALSGWVAIGVVSLGAIIVAAIETLRIAVAS